MLEVTIGTHGDLRVSRTALCRVNSHLDAVEDHTAHNNAEIYHSIIVGVCRRTAEVDDRTGKKHKYNA